MATTSSINLPSTATEHATPARFAAAWTVYLATVVVMTVGYAFQWVRWSLVHTRVEFRAIHLIPAVIGYFTLFLAVIALAFFA